MSITTLSRRMPPYTGNGSADTFPIDFIVLDASHLKVLAVSPAGVVHLFDLTTDYTFEGVGDPVGGELKLVSSGQPWLDAGKLADDWKLHVLGATPRTQTTAIKNQKGYKPKVHEDTFDRIVMLVQELEEIVGRSVKFPAFIPASQFNGEIPASFFEGGQVLVSNEDGDALESIDIGTLKGADGIDGVDGVGVPPAGAPGQVLVKASIDDFDTDWQDPAVALPTGGTTGQILSKASDDDGDAEWIEAPTEIPSGGTTGQVLAKASDDDGDLEWADQTGGGGGGDNKQEVPAGLVNGSNLAYELSEMPADPACVKFYVNGLLYRQGPGLDYSISGTTITILGDALVSGQEPYAVYSF